MPAPAAEMDSAARRTAESRLARRSAGFPVSRSWRDRAGCVVTGSFEDNQVTPALRVLGREDCPQDPLRGWTLAVLGYGNQGRAQALNLRDSGHAVVVSARAAGSGAARAGAEGFRVIAPEDLPAEADLVAVLLPDQVQEQVLDDLIARSQRLGPACRIRALVFAHAFVLRFATPGFLASWDVGVVAPAGPGVQLRERYLEGSGIPALLGIHRDSSGEAEARLRAYGAAIGCASAGMLATTPSAEAEIDLFGEQAVLCGGMAALCRTAFETLVEAGYPAEAAYLECVQQLRLTAELVEKHGIEGMRRRISPTALYGDLTRGPRVIGAGVKAIMSEILAEIRSGAFAAEWMARVAEEPGWPEEGLRRARHESLEAAGEIIRGLQGRPASGAGPGPGTAADRQMPD